MGDTGSCPVVCPLVLYSKHWLSGVLPKQRSVSLFPLLPSPVLVYSVSLGFHFTSTESLASVRWVLLWGLVDGGLWPVGIQPPLVTHALPVVSSVVTPGNSTSTCNTGVTHDT